MKCAIVPACIPTSRESLLEFTEQASFSDEIQIDVVDGQFVETVSWPYVPPGEPKTIKYATDPYTLEVDLMVLKPISAAQDWLAAGADMLVFHVESVDLTALRNFAETCPSSIGVACHGQTSLEDFFEYVAIADYVQLMGIQVIGVQGEPFDEAVLQKITAVKERFPEKMISIDGSVNTETIERLRAAGADRFVAGSAIIGQSDPALAYRTLCELVD